MLEDPNIQDILHPKQRQRRFKSYPEQSEKDTD